MRTGGPLALTLLLASLPGCATAPAPSRSGSVEADLDATPRRTEAERALVRGLVALKMGDYGAARAQLAALADACPDTPAGNRALLGWMSLEIDPRNPDRDLVTARRLGERYLLGPGKPAWTEPAAKTLYLLALDVGAGLPPRPTGETPAEGEAEAGPEGEVEPQAAADVADEELEGAEEAVAEEPGRLPLAASPPVVPGDCGMEGEGPRVGPLEPPSLSEPALALRHRDLQGERDSLQVAVQRMERQISELQRELERIRETLRP